jgi:hypothetical protein
MTSMTITVIAVARARESARFGQLYPVSDPGVRGFDVEVRFVNGDMNVDERVGRATLQVKAL